MNNFKVAKNSLINNGYTVSINDSVVIDFEYAPENPLTDAFIFIKDMVFINGSLVSMANIREAINELKNFIKKEGK